MKSNGCDYMILLYISKHMVSTQTDFLILFKSLWVLLCFWKTKYKKYAPVDTQNALLN